MPSCAARDATRSYCLHEGHSEPAGLDDRAIFDAAYPVQTLACAHAIERLRNDKELLFMIRQLGSTVLVSLVAAACSSAGAAPMAEDNILENAPLNGAGAPGLILTFDDGPAVYAAPVKYKSILGADPFPTQEPHGIATIGNSADLAAWLTRRGVRATFFMIGQDAERAGAKKLVERIVNAGHTVASHTYAHLQPFAKLAEDEKRDEIARADGVLFPAGADRNLASNTSGRLVRFLRTPGGGWSSAHAAGLNRRFGAAYVGPINWDIGGDEPNADWFCWKYSVSTAECTERYRQSIKARGGIGIVLLHDKYAQSALIAMTLVEERIRAGRRFYSLKDAPRIKAAMDRTLGLQALDEPGTEEP